MKINHHERAAKGWDVLTEIASQNKLITYGELGVRIGIHHRPVRHLLGLIQDYCLVNELPPLSILVVNKLEGKPGDGFVAWDADDIESGLKQVYEFNWGEHQNPFEFALSGVSEDELIMGLINDPGKSEEIYGIVKSRGAAPINFQKSAISCI